MSKVIFGLCVFVMLVVTPSVRADSFVITNGTIRLNGAFGGVSYNFSGPGFSLVGGGEGGFAQARTCTPCLAGSSLGGGMFIIGNGLGSGTVVINGTTFPGVSLRGTMDISSGGFSVPSVQTNVTLTSGFNMTASIFGCPGPFSPCDPPVFGTTLLQGSGTATLQLLFSGLNSSGVPLFFFSSLTYRFGPDTPEVPEPMTITLLTTGLLGLGAKLSLSRKRKREH